MTPIFLGKFYLKENLSMMIGEAKICGIPKISKNCFLGRSFAFQPFRLEICCQVWPGCASDKNYPWFFNGGIFLLLKIKKLWSIFFGEKHKKYFCNGIGDGVARFCTILDEMAHLDVRLIIVYYLNHLAKTLRFRLNFDVDLRSERPPGELAL